MFIPISQPRPSLPSQNTYDSSHSINFHPFTSPPPPSISSSHPSTLYHSIRFYIARIAILCLVDGCILTEIELNFNSKSFSVSREHLMFGVLIKGIHEHITGHPSYDWMYYFT
eukprot:TRINITY_DN535_c0_g1_i1.p1 TRINITY_DN535_c0_g1~~TRINITY_DN535_c0_g1_i1.p1  ORF type:complete len:113 (+),score=5.96 TRINITY_DN535_c0_g1_i1:381-719(+)